MNNAKRTAFGRRQFLRVLGAGATVAATPHAPHAKAHSETAEDKRKSRYKESDHIKTFYRVNRYPR